jgi:pimeloyl-ACP methyl ester carboxylesterase
VGALVLEDPPWSGAPHSTSMSADAAERAQQIAERKKLSPEEFLREGRIENPTWSEEEFEPWIEAKYQVSPNVFSYMTQDNVDWRGATEHIQCPTLLLTADPALDARMTNEVTSLVAAANPHIEVVNIAGAGHNIRREQLSDYLDAVLPFLERTYPSG